MDGMELPGYIKVKSKTALEVRAGSDWEGYKRHIVTVGDVVRYYATDARDISSGCRSLGSIVGDWRNVDGLAKECLEVFKQINRGALERAAEGHGMTLR